MAGFGNDAENEILDLVASGTAYTKGAGNRLSLHTGDPGENGTANEVVNAGGSTYARQPCTWTPASGGSVSLALNVDFDNMPAVTVTHFGVWTTAGEFRGGGTITNRTMILGDSYRANTLTTWTLD